MHHSSAVLYVAAGWTMDNTPYLLDTIPYWLGDILIQFSASVRRVILLNWD